jgi:hypothetical protein
MRSFSVQSPATRQFLNEWLFLEDLRRAGILAPRYSFVNVFVNGEAWGVYALEESFSKELLESQGRREGIIVRFDEGLFWERRALYGGELEQWKYGVDPIAATYASPAFAEVDEFNTNRVLSEPALAHQRATAFGLLRGFQKALLSPSEVFDAELMGLYLAHTSLWGAHHSLTWHNERYYYNPLTARLEPIGYDAMPLDARHVRFPNLAQYDDLGLMESYVSEVQRITQPGYLEQLKEEYEAEYARYFAALIEEFDAAQMEPPWESLADRQELLVSALNPPQTVYAYLSEGESDSTTKLQVANILRYAVALKELRIGELGTPIRPEWIADTETNEPEWLPEPEAPLTHEQAEPDVVLRRANQYVPRFLTLEVPNTVIDGLLPVETTIYSNTVQLVTSLYGLDSEVVVDAHWDYPPIAQTPALPAQPPLDEALERHPYLRLSEAPGFLELEPGRWRVDGDLVLPDGYGLSATEPVTLTFDQEAILFATGPLVLMGPTPGSIALVPDDEHWAGLFVLQAGPDQPSILQNVEIRATAGITRDGWITTGGVTFYESPVELSGSRLVDSLAEDAINVVRTTFQFVDTEFARSASDAFDGDFSEGRISHSSFHDIRGDGIDISGSKIAVDGVRLLRIHDKGISAGEGSSVAAEYLHASDVGIAVASKDMSRVIVNDSSISRAWIAAFAAYLKKSEYGPASIDAYDIEFQDGSRHALVQEGSVVEIAGETVAAGAIDVPALYLQLDALGRMQLLNYRLGTEIRLVGYELASAGPDPDGNVPLMLYWQADSPPGGDYSVSVHVVDAFGEIVSQRDRMPRDDSSPTTSWEPGELIDDLHLVPLSPYLPAGEYRLIVSLYDPNSGERLPVVSPDGEEIPEDAIVLDQTLVVSE